jgi:outer membrane protein, multidrug efflux system
MGLAGEVKVRGTAARLSTSATRVSLMAGSAVLCLGLAGCAAVPTPLSDSARSARVQNDARLMFADQEPIKGPIDLYEAIARGLKYNLDKRLKQMELGFADARLKQDATGMLPKVVADAGYNARDSYRGSSSRSLLTGAQSLEVSTSEDKQVYNADLNMVWNLLDFGLTYLHSKERADEVVIAEERRLKVVQNMIQDVRDAYWRAASAEHLLPRVNDLVANIEIAITHSQGVRRSGAAEPAEQLRVERELLSNLKDLTEVRRKLLLAKAELAALINVPPGSAFAVAVPDIAHLPAPHFKATAGELQRAALLNRPELREEDYKKRISLTEVDAAYVRLLPGIELKIGRNFDSNSFLNTTVWSTAAGFLTKNLVELATAERSIGVAEADVKVADGRRIALSMAVIAQVQIALQRFGLAQENFKVAGRLLGVDSELSKVAASGTAATSGSEIEALTALSRRTVSEMQYLVAYADLQNAYGRILNSVGANRLPIEIEHQGVATLKVQVRNLIDDWKLDMPTAKLAAR